MTEALHALIYLRCLIATAHAAPTSAPEKPKRRKLTKKPRRYPAGAHRLDPSQPILQQAAARFS